MLGLSVSPAQETLLKSIYGLPLSDADMNHVLHGHAPYPLLSVRDMRTVYLLLEARGMGARHIAERLHVHHRSVVRWRGDIRKAKERQ